ncbi:MAG: D-sedoheptulose 7-phosphate isomerase [Bacteroidales bacterium]|jgi:D-sedoheptulose 7-phosphate isomerase|nr:D-sedoheptulose 7-phosphate isomerase [Bacteroidales bacterium]
MKNKIIDRLEQSVAVKKRIMEDAVLLKNIEAAAESITAAYRNNKKVLLCGNGGSAADAQHIAAEFSGRFYFDRPPLSAEALHVNTSFLTAVGNDYSFDIVYARMIEASANEGDVLIALSTSGNSANIIRAIETAKRKGLFVIGFSGQTGGKMKDICDCLLNVPSVDTPRIQESHITVAHIICEFVEQNLFGTPNL